MKERDILLVTADSDLERQARPTLEVEGVSLLSCDPREAAGEIRIRRPRLVLLDLETANGDVMALMRQAVEEEWPTRFVAIMRREDFHLLQSAVRLGAADCLIAPLQADELQQMAQRLLHPSKAALPRMDAAASRLQLLKDIHLSLFTPMPLEDVNRRYETRFRDGLFCVMLIKVDVSEDQHLQIVYENDNYYQAFTNCFHEHLDKLCCEILFDKLSDSTLAVLNYPRENDMRIRNAIEKMYRDIKQIFAFMPGLKLTLCISHASPTIADLPELKSEVLDSRWSRIERGANKIILPAAISDERLYTPSQVRLMFKLSNQIEQAFEVIDFPLARKHLESFFHLPADLLASRNGRMLTKSCIDSLFNIYFRIVASDQEAQDLRHQFIYTINMATSFDKIYVTFCKEAERIIARITDKLQSTYSKPVYDTILYINHHVKERIRLSDLAEAVHLAPAYLSTLFCRETGKCITQFITDTKMGIAKKLLSENLLNIAEIADYLGYEDPRYFSKVFHKAFGVTPSAYKRIQAAQA